jgi:hypothetical protein
LTVIDLLALYLRFSSSNDQVRRRYGVSIGTVSSSRLVRECVTFLLADRDVEARRARIRLHARAHHDRSVVMLQPRPVSAL